ncbi:hypothetical protein FQ377_01720 [Arthrobacter echini]|uniref:Uncharacterized protein n=1 Tax=Arthrobacter echini TaxID=1529066 RepID=A0A5D0XU42_9MICC|nr:hypothetical protein [Arthrobacter echini]TYD00206.1 hypothetical protein FQ377_01720 [Arthrobacter echini]
MSTPQDNPGTGRDGQLPDQGAAQDWTTPGTTGAGQFDQQGQSGHQGTQPSGYAYPTSAVDAAPADKGPVPKEVMRAYYLILAAGVVYLLSAILSALTTEVPDVAGASLGVALGLVFAVIMAAVYVLLAVFIRRGRNWARITATVLAALNVVFSLGSLLLLPTLNDFAEANGQQVADSSALPTILGLIVMLLGVIGVIMTYLKPARPYFVQPKLGY